MSSSSIPRVTSSQALFEAFRPLTDAEYTLAASALALILPSNANHEGEGSSRASFSAGIEPHVIDVLYSTTKYLPHLDQMIFSTDLLSIATDLVPHLPLVKLLLFQLVAAHFDPAAILVAPDPTRNPPNATVRRIVAVLADQKTKLHAAYARVRIALRAHGASEAERLRALVDWNAAAKADMAPVAFRVRVSRSAFADAACACIPGVSRDEEWAWDEAQADLVRIPAEYVGDLLASPLVATRAVVMQDPCAGLPVQMLLDVLIPAVAVALTDAGEGRSPVVLDASIKSETRPLMYRDYCSTGSAQFYIPPLARCKGSPGAPAVRDLDRDFFNLDPTPNDPIGAVLPDIIVVEPENTLSGVLDERHFMLQEHVIKQAPPLPAVSSSASSLAELDPARFVSKQVAMLGHALRFASAKFVIYITRSQFPAENQDVLASCLQSPVGKSWQLFSIPSLETADEEDATPRSDEEPKSALGPCDSGVLGLDTEVPAMRDPWLFFPANPPMLTAGMFLAILARKATPIVTSKASSCHTSADGVADDDLLRSMSSLGVDDGEPDNVANIAALSTPEAKEMGPLPTLRKKKKTPKRHRFSLGAWRRAALGVGKLNLADGAQAVVAAYPAPSSLAARARQAAAAAIMAKPNSPSAPKGRSGPIVAAPWR